MSIALENAQLMSVRGATDRAVFFGQRYGTARLRLWQLYPSYFKLLGYRIEPFSVVNAYLLAQSKHFINSAWRYELFHTRLAGKLTPEQHQHLFTTFSEEGSRIPPLPPDIDGQWLPIVKTALAAGRSGLRYLGISSPDTGSNVIAISGRRSASGSPLLATDPHMGQVNPGFNLLCRLSIDEGMEVIGSHFPGAPGLIVGRNRYASWGMVGIMADNQDLFFGQMDPAVGKVKTADGWVKLTENKQQIARNSGSVHQFTASGFSQGRLLMEKNGYGLFLRWSALEKPAGDITFYALAKCRDWQSFRHSLSRVNNSPMMVGYADIHGDIGLQAMGMIPKRRCNMGSLVMDLTNPDHQWQGYVPFDELPSLHNPPEGYAVYANLRPHRSRY